MRLYLLGVPSTQLNSNKVPVSLSRPFFLLVYLACKGEWVNRAELTFFLRPDVDKDTAQQYVRKLVSNARKIPWVTGFEVETERLRWQIDTDVEQFRLACKNKLWSEAVRLYRGPLMGNESVSFLPSYDLWLQVEREALDHDWKNAALHYVRDLESSNQPHEAAAMAKQLMNQDSFNEDALQSYLRNAYFMGQRDQALKAAHDFKIELKSELGIDPALSTQQLVEDIRLSKPIEKHVSSLRYGRRKDDIVTTTQPHEKSLDELVALLGLSGSRVMSVNSSDNDEATITIAQRVTNARTALLSIVRLATQLIEKQHKARALELLLLVINHPACDLTIKEEVYKLWPGLDGLANP